MPILTTIQPLDIIDVSHQLNHACISSKLLMSHSSSKLVLVIPGTASTATRLLRSPMPVSDSLPLESLLHTNSLATAIQGRDCLIQKFRNSSVMLEDPSFRPKVRDHHSSMHANLFTDHNHSCSTLAPALSLELRSPSLVLTTCPRCVVASRMRNKSVR